MNKQSLKAIQLKIIDQRLGREIPLPEHATDGSAGIRSGVKAGDLVVTAGQIKLYPSLRVAIVDDVPELEQSSQ